MKIRIKFQKTGVLRYVGHLDVMRFFQRMIKRAGIDVCYTQGFSPHQIMSFAAPLGIDLTSEAEYLDIEVHTTMSSEEAVRALNEHSVPGIEIVSCRRLPEDAKNAMSLVAAADYLLLDKEGMLPFADRESLQKHIDIYYNRSVIEVCKKTKKGERMLDIRPLIYTFTAVWEEEDPGVFLRLSTGSTENIKPELVMEDFCSYFQISYDRYAFDICRKEIYARVQDQLISLEDLGEEISTA